MTVAIRVATPADAEAVRSIYSPSVTVSHTSFELEVPSAEAIAARIAALEGRLPWLVCEEDGAPMGYAYAAPFRDRPAYAWTVETSVYVDGAHHRRGVGRALYRALLGCLRLQGYRMVIGGIALPNDASVALHESFGFRRVGTFSAVGFKFGGWHPVGFWELDLLPLAADPPPPRPWRVLDEDERVRALLREAAGDVRLGA